MDFSGAALHLTVAGERDVITTLGNIDQQAQQMMQNISDAVNKAVASSLRINTITTEVRKARVETEALGESTLGLSRSSIIGLGEMSRGIARVAQAGEVGAFAMREFTGAAFRLTSFLGPAGELLPVVGLLGFALHEVFASGQKDMDDMKRKFEDDLTEMVNTGRVTELKKKAQDIWLGTPAKDFADGLGKLEQQEADIITRMNATAGITHAALKKQLDDFRSDTGIQEKKREFDEFRKEILDTQNMPLSFPGLPAMKVEANAPGRTPTVPELDALRQRLSLSRELVPQMIAERDPLRLLQLEEADLRIQLERSNLTTAKRIELLKELERVTKEIGEEESNSVSVGGVRVRVNVKPAPVPKDDQVEAVKKSTDEMESEAHRAAKRISDALGTGLLTALSTGSIAKGFQAMTEAVLKGFADMLAQVAESALIGSQIMQQIYTFFATNPWLAAAAAVSLLLFAKSMGGSGSGASGGSYGGGGYYGGGTIVDRGIINPMAPAGPVTPASSITPRGNVTLQPIIIGIHDANAQRMLQEMMKRANKRGSA